MSVINSGPKRKDYSDHSSCSYSGIGPKERTLSVHWWSINPLLFSRRIMELLEPDWQSWAPVDVNLFEILSESFGVTELLIAPNLLKYLVCNTKHIYCDSAYNVSQTKNDVIWGSKFVSRTCTPTLRIHEQRGVQAPWHKTGKSPRDRSGNESPTKSDWCWEQKTGNGINPAAALPGEQFTLDILFTNRSSIVFPDEQGHKIYSI